MNTDAKPNPSSAGPSGATSACSAGSAALSPTSNQLLPPGSAGIAAGGSSSATPAVAGAAGAETNRTSSSAPPAGGSRSGSQARKPHVKSPRSEYGASSKSTRTEGSHRSSHPETPSPRIVYGSGTLARLPTELERLGVTSPLIVSSPSRITLARRIQGLIPSLHARILDSAVVNVPARVVDEAVARIDDRDVVISVGGASALGLAKAIGCRKGIPHVCIPTTYSASEMMPLLLDACPARHGSVSGSSAVGDASRSSSSSSSSKSKSDRPQRRDSATRGGSRKSPRTTSFRDPRVLPEVIIYDEDLTMSMPKRFSAPSGDVAMARLTERRDQDDTAQWSYLHLPGV
ncbi:uncharacterized protein UV8b_03242 [Ustilaginoidea virens]|uniref:Alcohol dehydrogenase iron-type/glycerol dehydrogenase GldA domain-containing protein n=1 Tax=Ustilaginoidea virens TaxID=1159556 RepID=A0A8E5HP51_USTVR|nr:uncharacterized protein UV8b_03242 [Ustilaginoidea virens]QUC19001.1 hypothetical protein UV8b_03242 [Ustilaginoidea virens]